MPATDTLPEIRCEPGMLVIADLHLAVASDEARETAFERCLGTLRDVPRLVILGDLFEAWIDPAQAERAGASSMRCATSGSSTRPGEAT